MYMVCEHRTAPCPACKKDSWQSDWEATFSVVRCIWCGAKFKNGKVVKNGNKNGRDD